MMIGKRISGRYKVLKMIGGGGMANVYLAHDMILDRDVAVKVLRLDFANDEEFIRRFHREALSATSLAHPNIVTIYDVGEEQSIYYIVMEYVDGQTLKQYIQQHSPIPIDKALSIMGQITSAISHAHHNHIIHRDIKPDNILIDKQGNVKITDFGIAMALSATSITQTNSVIGSVHYLSPEQARGGQANYKSDIYSLGIVMFELLTGRPPFSGESAVSIALKHLQSETPSVRRWNPTIPQSVENIVLKATAKDPFHRYNSVDEMEDDIRRALDPERINEPKFVIPEDHEATKAIPIITEDKLHSNLDETIIHNKEKMVDEKTLASEKKTVQEQNGKKRRKWPAILISVFISLIILGVLAVTVFPGLFEPKDIEVPDVSGMELDKAIAELLSAGLVIGETKEITHNEIEEGYVVKTEPKAGRIVKEGTKVDVYESIGKEPIEMLDYTERKYDEVLALLKDKNFKDIRAIEIHDDKEAGTILEQNYPKGEKVIPEETILEFTVSKGPALITLIDLREHNIKAVQDYAESTGLKVDFSQEQYDNNVPKGLVITQEPEPGTKVEKGSTIKVIISKGPEEIPPATVPIEMVIPYDPAVEGEEQTVQIYVEDMNRSMTKPFDSFTITETTTRVIELDILPGTTGGYMVIRDGKVIAEEEVPYPG